MIPNLLQRDFTTERPNQKWRIDISYLFGKQRTVYLCAIKDMYDKSIIAYQMSRHMDMSFVIKTIDIAVHFVPQKQREGLILHSDQGDHFTGPQYQRLLKKYQIKHSVSYRDNCVDNNPIESWFSALKTESIYLYPKLPANELTTLVNDYVKYYNEEGLQEKLKELAPIDYRKQALSGLFNNCPF